MPADDPAAEPAAPKCWPGQRGPLQWGEPVLLIDRDGNRYLVALHPGKLFQFHRGVIPHEHLVGLVEGSEVRSSLGKPLRVFRPRLMDYLLEMPRSSTILYPKDLGAIWLWADILPGARVLEAGIGSGAGTLALLRAVGAQGEVVVYEQRADMIAQARRNIRQLLGDPPNLRIEQRDIYAGVGERDLDRILLDLPEPWQVVPHAATALREGGIFCAYNPSIVQVQSTVEALRRSPCFGQIETIEVLYRPWIVRGSAVRPEQHMVAHTGFITVARRQVPTASSDAEPAGQ